MSRNIIKIICKILLVCIIAFILLNVVPFLIFYNAVEWSAKAEYKEFSEEFNMVKDYFLYEYPNESDDKYFSIDRVADGEIRIYDSDLDEYVEVPDDIKLTLVKLDKEACPNKHAGIDIIRIYGERISFSKELGSYALVYSPNERPDYIFRPDEDEEISVRKAGKDWYHIIVQ